MTTAGSNKDGCYILVKAQPHRSSKYFETVCCAGVGKDGKWRRQYPIPFRVLNDYQKFKRWDWIAYEFTKSLEDRRAESQKVIPESLTTGSSLKQAERARLIEPLVRESFTDADEKKESLALIRPKSLEISWKEKSPTELDDERRKHADLAAQISWLDQQAKPLVPCPILFKAKWKGGDGKLREHECDDWETSAAFNKFESMYGRSRAIEVLKSKYENEYFKSGLVLAFSTHSRRNVTFGTRNQWLLVGIIRLDQPKQSELAL